MSRYVTFPKAGHLIQMGVGEGNRITSSQALYQLDSAASFTGFASSTTFANQLDGRMNFPFLQARVCTSLTRVMLPLALM